MNVNPWMRMVRRGLGVALAATSLFALSNRAVAQLELVVGAADLPRTLDPPGETSNTGMRVLPNVFETLIAMDPENNSHLLPGLAVSWQRVTDNVLELNLREGVVFHNGDPFTSADVKFSFERLLAEDSAFSLAKSLVSQISTIEIVDDHTIRLITEEPDPILEFRVASVFGSWIVPEKYMQEVGEEVFSRQPVGTGPFKVTNYSPDRIVLERFADYWGPQPVVDKVVFREIPEVAARITALVNGEVDIITQIPPDQIQVLGRYDNVSAKSQVLANMHVLIVNTLNPPTDDPLLRRALSLGINRELLSAALWSGEAVVPRSHQYLDFGPMLNTDRPMEEYDPELARELVAQSSYNGEVLNYNVQDGYYTNEVEAAEVIVEMWKDIGVNARVRIMERSQRNSDDRNLLPWSNSERFPDPLGGLWLLWGDTSSRQGAGEWEPADPDFNRLGNFLATSLDQEQRYEAFQQMLDIFETEMPGILLYYPSETWGVNNKWDWTPFQSHVMDFRPAYLQYVGD